MRFDCPERSITTATPPTVQRFLRSLPACFERATVPVYSETGNVPLISLTWKVNVTRCDSTSTFDGKTTIEIFGLIPDYLLDSVYREKGCHSPDLAYYSTEQLEREEKTMEDDFLIDPDQKLCVAAKITISDYEPKIAKIASYDVRDCITGTGLTGRFYKCLDDTFTRAGFDMIYGVNNSDNIGYFIQKHDRRRLSEFDDATQTRVLNTLSNKVLRDCVTVKVLR